MTSAGDKPVASKQWWSHWRNAFELIGVALIALAMLWPGLNNSAFHPDESQWSRLPMMI